MTDADIYSLLNTQPGEEGPEQREMLAQVWEQLRRGTLRAASKSTGEWIVNPLVKEVILWAFRIGVVKSYPAGPLFSFTDKDTLPVQDFAAERGCRIVPGGTTVRDGAYLAPGVIVMPPAYVNIGAYVDSGSLIDSHALVGSCAQIGKNVHLSAAVQIGGVLEPVGAMPVIIEDDVLVGGNCGIYEGTRVSERAVIGTGVVLTRSTPVYDLVHQSVHAASDDSPLVIPPDAVVVQGCRPARGEYAREHGISIYTPVIVKYRDAKTSGKSALERSLRDYA
jgi:2,3,4,5-tetrahydropyridine-2-carboxylate N-succinyltransferase